MLPPAMPNGLSVGSGQITAAWRSWHARAPDAVLQLWDLAGVRRELGTLGLDWSTSRPSPAASFTRFDRLLGIGDQPG